MYSAFRKIAVRVWNGDPSFFYWVPELVMATLYSNFIPTILFDLVDHIFASHFRLQPTPIVASMRNLVCTIHTG